MSLGTDFDFAALTLAGDFDLAFFGDLEGYLPFFVAGVLAFATGDFLGFDADFLTVDLEGLLLRDFDGGVFFAGVLAGVFALDFAGDFAGVLPRYFEADLSGDFDFFAVDFPGVFEALAGVLARDSFSGCGEGGAKILEEEPILEGDFFGVLSRFFDLPYLSSSFISTSGLSSDFTAKPNIAVGLSSFISAFLSAFVDLDLFDSLVLAALLGLGSFGFFSFLADLDLALDADFLGTVFDRVFFVSFFCCFLTLLDVLAGDLEAERCTDLAGEDFFETGTSFTSSISTSSTAFLVDYLPEVLGG